MSARRLPTILLSVECHGADRRPPRWPRPHEPSVRSRVVRRRRLWRFAMTGDEARDVIDALPSERTAPTGWVLRPSRWSIIRAVCRRLIPYIIEATLIPTAIFYALLFTASLRWALLGALCWSYAAVVRRIASAKRVPCLLVFGAGGISLRAIVYLLSTNSFVYFMQPIVRGLLTAMLFATSALIGRPLVARFANDFCPTASDVNGLPAIVSLFRRLTYLWAGLNLALSGTSLALLLTVPIGVFVGTTAASTWIITGCGVVVTVFASTHVARREGLATAVDPNGTLHAYIGARPVGLAEFAGAEERPRADVSA